LGAVSVRVGIEKIGVYPCSLSLAMPDLCAARGQDPAHIRDTMLIDERSLNPPWEDPVTMAVNAANPILSEEDRRNIELLIVASESGVDYEKPLSTWVQRYLDLTPHCRNFEVKHACYGATAGLQMAASWLSTSHAPDAKALVIGTDQSRVHFGKPWEFVLGAGAAAVLVSRTPAILEFEMGKNGYWTYEISDLMRPTSRVETGHSETSLVSYMEALEHAYAHYVERVPEATDFDGYFQRNVYHTPFGGIVWRAHRTLLRLWSDKPSAYARASFEEKTLASLIYTRRMGATYSSSTFIGLASLFANSNASPGERIGIFSYGSGSCAEYYSGLAGIQARERAQGVCLGAQLDRRRRLSIREYEQIEQYRTDHIDCGDYVTSRNGVFGDWYDTFYRDRRFLVFDGMKDYYRQYSWS
jgi:hydroxymethylglutaryl-CoA synthase